MSRVRWRTERSEACPGRGPARITLRVLRRKKNTAATGSRVRLPGAGHRHGPRCHGWRSGEGARARHRCPAAHSPAVKDRSTYSGAQRPARGVGARCHHAARQRTPAPRPARACAVCPPARTVPATAVRLARPPALAGCQQGGHGRKRRERIRSRGFGAHHAPPRRARIHRRRRPLSGERPRLLRRAAHCGRLRSLRRRTRDSSATIDRPD